MRHRAIELETEDGRCPADVYAPDGGGPWPAVLVYADAIGIRPVMRELAARLAADAGAYVLLPDLFWRLGRYEVPDAATLATDSLRRMAHIRRLASAAQTMRDTPAFLAHLAAEPAVRQPTIAVVGYCMGGRAALGAAGHFPDRVALAASFHGGNLATDAPDSPHLLVARMRARVYVAGAIEDASFPDEQRDRLAAALAAAGVDHTIETYPARHGWVMADLPVYDAAAAERHWRTLVDLLRRWA